MGWADRKIGLEGAAGGKVGQQRANIHKDIMDCPQSGGEAV